MYSSLESTHIRREQERQAAALAHIATALRELEVQLNKNGQATSKGLPPTVATTPPPPPVEIPTPKESDDRYAKYRERTLEAFRHSWRGYVQYGQWSDEFHPISGGGRNWGGTQGIGVMVADSMSTMAVMGLEKELAEALDYTETQMTFQCRGCTVSRFETTIRMLGGLISTYELTGRRHPVLLKRASHLAGVCTAAFGTASGLPMRRIDVGSGSVFDTNSNLAEVGSDVLELRATAMAANSTHNFAAANRAFRTLRADQAKLGGLLPTQVDTQRGDSSRWSGPLSIGAEADSYYEYLLKAWLQSGGADDGARVSFLDAVRAMLAQLAHRRSERGGFTFFGTRYSRGAQLTNDFGHLVCFAGAMLALGAHSGAAGDDAHLRAAMLEAGVGVGRACRIMYNDSDSGIGPENGRFDGGKFTAGADFYILRPEVVETYFVLWRVTRDETWREAAAQAFDAIDKHCRVEHGYSAVQRVSRPPLPHSDSMESFWLAETLKYLYLTFSPDSALDLSKWVFNTEAHPLPVVPKEEAAPWIAL